MQNEISKVWVLEQFTKLQESLKNDLEKVDTKLQGYVSHGICDERRNQDGNERERVAKRLDIIDEDMEKMQDSFDENLSHVRQWGWGIMGAIIGELIIVIMNLVMKH